MQRALADHGPDASARPCCGVLTRVVHQTAIGPEMLVVLVIQLQAVHQTALGVLPVIGLELELSHSCF